MKRFIRQFDHLLHWLQRLFKRKRRARPPLTTSYPAIQTHIQQDSQGDRNQIIARMSGGTAIERVKGSVYISPTIYQIDLEPVKQVVQEKYVDPVKQGLNALAALIQIPEVRRSVTTFQVAFEAACQQIDSIANYKALHDLLHSLEFHCYNGIVQELERLSKDPIGLDNLIDYDWTLQNLLAKIQKVTASETISVYETQWLSDLEKAQEKLHTFLEKLELEFLRECKWRLNRVLSIQLSRINTYLVAAAQSLRLAALVDAMQVIAAKLADANLDQEKLQQFQQGVNSLRVLNSRLTVLVIEHDNWQIFDLELRRIEANLEQDIIELEMSWPDLQERAKRTFNLSADQRMVMFEQYSQNLDAALRGQDPVIVKQCFRIYCKQAKENFYQVDLALKCLCEELREVGRALASVLEVIG